MRLRSVSLGAVAALSAVPCGAQERTGPNAVPPSLPAYLQATAPLPVTLPAAEAAPSNGTTVRFTDVTVSADGTGFAPPQPAWHPVADPVLGLTLAVPGPGGFDAAWVRQQFVANRLIGADITLDRVTALVQSINLAFAANGYINSGVLIADTAPAPVLNGDVLRLTLVHGRLSGATDVRWGAEGAKGMTAGYVIVRMRDAKSVPLDAAAVERSFRLLAEDPAISTVKADLVPGARPGEAGLALTVDPARRADAYVSYGNSRSPAIGGDRVAIGGYIRNLFAAGDVFSVEAGLTAKRPDYLGSYETPFLTPNLLLSLRASHNEASVVDRPLVPLDIRARDVGVEGGLSYRVLAEPLTPRGPGVWSAARSLTLGIRIGHRETETFLLGQPFSFSPGSVDGRSRQTVLRLTADFVERGISKVTALSFTLTQGLSGTRSTIPGVASPDPHFRSYLAQLSHARRLTPGGLELRLRLTGQWADGLLYSGERLSVGGEYTVRGYRETLALVDTGVIGSVELAQPFSLSRGGRDAKGTDWAAFSLSAFADGALLRNRRDPQPVPDRLGSVGVSLAWVPSEAISARITYARALVDAVPVGSRDLQDRGFQFRLTVRPLLLFR
jgi:hemolysin activation/secretion protein